MSTPSATSTAVASSTPSPVTSASSSSIIGSISSAVASAASSDVLGTLSTSATSGASAEATERSGPTTSTMPSAAIGGALGGIIAICLGIIVFLLVRLSRTRDRTQLITSSEQQHLSYAGDDTKMSPEASELQYSNQRLAEAQAQVARLTSERNLAASLIPTVTRDGSDYLREVELINGNIRQLSMRLAGVVGIPSQAIRIALCHGLGVNILGRFDWTMNETIDSQLRSIYIGFDNIDRARIWRAMTIRQLPIDTQDVQLRSLAEKLVQRLDFPLQPAELLPLVTATATLSRYLAREASVYTVTHYPSGKDYDAECMLCNKPPQGIGKILGTEAFGVKQQDGIIVSKALVNIA